MARRLPRVSHATIRLSFLPPASRKARSWRANLLLLTLVLCVPWQAARAQDVEARDGAVIESVDLGLPRDSLSPGLRREPRR